MVSHVYDIEPNRQLRRAFPETRCDRTPRQELGIYLLQNNVQHGDTNFMPILWTRTGLMVLKIVHGMRRLRGGSAGASLLYIAIETHRTVEFPLAISLPNPVASGSAGGKGGCPINAGCCVHCRLPADVFSASLHTPSWPSSTSPQIMTNTPRTHMLNTLRFTPHFDANNRKVVRDPVENKDEQNA